MCMKCDSKEQHSHVNKKRLSLLLGTIGLIVVAAVGAVLLSPALIGIIPLLVVFAACPAMCTVGMIISWVKRGGKPTVIPSIKEKEIEPGSRPEIQQQAKTTAEPKA